MEEKHIGFILNKTPYKENDCILQILNEKNEKIVCKARGILKITSKNATACNPFVIAEYVLQAKTDTSNKTLKTATIIKMYHRPFTDLIASSVYEMILNFINQVQEQIDIYDFAIQCFNLLEDKNNYPIDVANYFFKTLSKQLGYAPLLTGCVSCQKKNNLMVFDFASGGFICSSCLPQYHLKEQSVDYLKSIYYFLKKENFTFLEKKYAQQLFFQYLQFLKEEMGMYSHYSEFFQKIL